MLNYREPLRVRDYSTSSSASESPTLFLVRSLLYPLVPVVTLVLCVIAAGEPLDGPYVLIAVLAFIGAADLLDLAPIEVPRAWWLAVSTLIDIVLRWLLLISFIWALLELVGLAQQFHWQAMVAWAVVTPLVFWVGRLYAPELFVRAGRTRRIRKAVIVGTTPVALHLTTKLRTSPFLNIEVLGFFDDRAIEDVPDELASRMLGDFSQVDAFVAQHGIDLVYITLPLTGHARVRQVLQGLQDSTASVYFVPDLTDCDLVQPRFDLVNGIPVVAVCESPFYGLRGMAKRCIDVGIASASLIGLTPIMLAVALAVRLTSPGPIIFKQRRYGLDGKEINVYKFRSMTVTEDGNSTYTQVSRGDARVTRVGAFIRRTSLDELPQLFNVLEGSMSIVGPRPHAIAVNEQYRRLIPGYMIRHKVKPGVTGWAQVNGFRGGDDLGSMRQRIEFDLQYLQHWSLTLDLIIILRTALVVWKDRHAY